MTTKRIMKIGFDLDGVIIDKPPLIPKRIIEWFVRSSANKHLAYRYPKSSFERWVRWLTHHPFFRPPIIKNIELVQKLSQNINYELYIVSSRYSFLRERTDQWFKFYRLDGAFKKVYLNQKNEQPHLFKEKMIKKLRLDLFIDDDLPLVKYLKRNIKGVSIVSVEEQRNYLKDLTR